MFRVISKITFVQQPTADFPGRTKTHIYNFVHSWGASNSWKDLTDKAKVILPKNVKVKDAVGRPVSLGALIGAPDNVNIGGFSSPVPLFLRGDKVTIEAGYGYFDARGNEVFPTNVIFDGYISCVTSKKPIELECEDNMWKLKQVNAPNKAFPSPKYTAETMLAEMIRGSGLPFTVFTQSQTFIGTFISTDKETIAQVLARLRKDYCFECYFRGTQLRVGSLVYIEQDAVDDGKKVFRFQKNIISDQLEYKRVDDINLSATAHSIITVAGTGHTKDGHPKSKRKCLDVLVMYKNGSPVSIVKQPHTEFPPNTEGERLSFNFLGASSTQQLIDLATAKLKVYQYTGYRGKFTTFGLPYVRHGDNVDILDPVLLERCGRYKVKAVKYTGGVGGLRQEIELDYLITRLDPAGNAITS
ncbi:MAG TPA: hypothetical protein VG605_16710 [Puia sp.]|nr:hypothetical protein [Puia sp.]